MVAPLPNATTTARHLATSADRRIVGLNRSAAGTSTERAVRRSPPGGGPDLRNSLRRGGWRVAGASVVAHAIARRAAEGDETDRAAWPAARWRLGELESCQRCSPATVEMAPQSGDKPYPKSVSCPTASFCVAVDESTDAVTYNGSRWKLVVRSASTVPSRLAFAGGGWHAYAMTAGATPPETTNGELIRSAFEILNTHDVEALKQFWTADTVERFPTETSVGPDAIGAYFQAAFDALPDFRIQVVGLAAQGDDVFVQWRLTGTHSGALWQGIAPTGRAVELDGMDHFVLRDGKVTSNFLVFDQMQFARSVGMMPSDGTPADRALKATFNAKTRITRRTKR